jgi:lipopolysaccharide heptosyltransferase I
VPFPFSSSDPISILIVKLSAIGDVVHTIPALTALRRAFPRARIGWVVEELSAPLLHNNPDLNDLFVVRRRWRTRRFVSLWNSEIRPFVSNVRRVRWDVAFDFQGLTKSSVYAWLSRARLRVGYGDQYGRELSKLFNNRRFKPDPTSEFHVVRRHMHLVRQMAPEAPTHSIGTIHLSESEREGLRAKLAEAGRTDNEPLLCINPAGGWSSKLWPADFYAEAGAEIASRHDLRPLVLWGPREENLRDAVMEGLRRRGTDPLAAPPTTIREMCSLLSHCRFYIGGDTGPSHIAGLLGIPNVTIFGASDAARNRPWPLHSGLAVQSGEFDCVPCWKRRCPLVDDENLKCLRRLEPARVIEAAERLLSGSGA